MSIEDYQLNGTGFINTDMVGRIWTQAIHPNIFGGSSLQSMAMSKSGKYAVDCLAGTGKLYYSITYGTNWTVATQPVTTANWVSVSMSADGQYVVACAYGGNIYYSETYGTSWIVASQPDTVTTANWNSVSISGSGQYAVACADGGNIYYSNTYGQSWTEATQPTSLEAGAIWSSMSMSNTGKYVVACVQNGNIYYSNTYGQSWSASTAVSSSWRTISISGSGQYAIASNGTLAYYSTLNNFCGNVMVDYNILGTNIGESLNLLSFSVVANSITPSGYTTKILQYNTGESWTVAIQPSGVTSANWRAVSMSATGQYAIACVFTTGKIYYSSDYGASWSQSNSATGVWMSVNMSTSGQYALGCTGGSTGGIHYSNDYGKTWTNSSNGLFNYVSVSMSASGQYGVCCYKSGTSAGRIYYSINYGRTWTVNLTTPANFESVSMSASGQYCSACAFGGLLYNSIDYGMNWTSSFTPQSIANWRSVSISASGQYGLACVEGGTIWYSSNYGITWTSTTSGLPTTELWYSVSMSSTGQYAVASHNTVLEGKIYYSSNYGESWTLSSSIGGVWSSVAISASGQYAVGAIYGGQIYYSANTLVATTTKDLADVFEPLYKYKTWVSVDSAYTWSGISTSVDGKYVVACTGGTGSIYYSSDYGVSFATATINANTTTPDWNGISMSNTGQYVFACQSTQSGRIFRSTDYGMTWNLSSPAVGSWLSIAISSTGKNIIATNINIASPVSRIYVSTNGNATTPTWTYTGFTAEYLPSAAISGNGKYAITCKYTLTSLYSIYSITIGTSPNPVMGVINIRCCAMSGDGQYAIVGSFGAKIFYSANNGLKWFESNSASESWNSLSMSESGQYCVAACENEKIYYSNDYGVNWTSTTATDTTPANATKNIAISKNGQYAFLTTTSGTIWRCVATNT
jgi:hypothetical protein